MYWYSRLEDSSPLCSHSPLASRCALGDEADLAWLHPDTAVATAGCSGTPTAVIPSVHGRSWQMEVGDDGQLRVGCVCMYTSKNGRRERVTVVRVFSNGDSENLCTISCWHKGQHMEADVPIHRLRGFGTSVELLRERIQSRLPRAHRASTGIAHLGPTAV